MPYKDPDNQRRKAREYYYQHREEVLRKRAAYREQNRERLAAAERERFRNRDVEEWNAKRRVYDETYREKKREDPEWVERQQAHRQRQQERGKAHIAEMLSSGCLFCGAPGEVFHHFYPLNKENTIAGMGNRSLEVIDAEAANCWVVCECCHSNIHRRLLDPLPIAYEYNALNQGELWTVEKPAQPPLQDPL